ncbi:uridine-preferring nucleoside hydrolase UriH [Cellulomonas triticagri]|uniref:Nucleoside hydrolase n=1 Tax=Cellulomonas triticagri TaxID=2483352 RepID=A0A3M2JBT0_9CELL|nr:nucleoside hydrolase [Cellulomonas triticagri]RMI09280.1 nucleoside hydrolase [Cellulomonas triticagri]
MPRAIILDCDPGHDDAIALLLAHGSPEIELLAVTTVAGNQSLDRVTRNARAVARVAGLVGVPVAAGADRPLVRERVEMHAASVHGESGLDGPALPEPTEPLDPRHAVDLIVETVMSRPPGTVTLVPTGPLTNIALAVRREPRLVERVRQVVLMGGAARTGNATPVAEFNVLTDPEAARVVLRAGWDVVMVGLDLTHQALATPDVVRRIADLGTPPARFVVELLDFFTSAYRDALGFGAPPVHDACAVAYVADPTVMTVHRAPIDVELAGELTTGMTVTDLRDPAPGDCPTAVALDLDRERFWDAVLDALARLGPGGA